jgi:hypothetical protein
MQFSWVNLKFQNFVVFSLRAPFLLRDSVVGIATGYRLDGRGYIPGRIKIFLFSTAFSPDLEPTQPFKRPGLQDDNSPPSSTVVKLYIYSPIFLHGIVLNYLSTGRVYL